MKLKVLLEDFVVYEVPLVRKYEKQGRFSYFILMKKDYTTISALKLISKKIRIPLKYFGFAGNKDRKAITFQLCSVRFAGMRRLEKVSLKGIKVVPVGKGDSPIRLGDLKGNYFKIVVRDLDKEVEIKERFLLNLFDEQRFGKEGMNAEIGRLLVKKRFSEAASLIRDKEIEEHLKKNPNDYVGALRRIPHQLLKLYVHAYQSWLWNKCAENLSKSDLGKDAVVPIIGFGIELERYPDEIKGAVSKIMQEEGITLRDFVFHRIPELSASGDDRKLFVKPEIVSYRYENDELNNGKKKLIIKFFLPKGCYATSVVKQLLGFRPLP